MTEESVRVIVRVRPLNQNEQMKGSNTLGSRGQSIISVDSKENQVVLVKPAEKENRQAKQFCFDAVFGQGQSQMDLYEATAQQLIGQVIEGYNGTIFAYGQTGSGKTYTMMGVVRSEEEQGIIPRTFEQLVTTIKSKSNKNFLIQCSYMEIYNEEIYDLLSGNLKNRLEIRESLEKGVFVKDIRKVTVTSISEMLRYLTIGNNNRSVAETLMNNESSRSHAIFTLYVDSSERTGECQRFTAAKFNLVDLAGSERQSKTGSTGDRLKEASKINLSLSALGNVISALVDGKSNHIPYRDSKLTRLLQDSLGGNTKTIMIANVSPCASNYEQTLSTLRYASRAKYIQNAPVINEDPKDTLLREYEQEIKRLRCELDQLQSVGSPSQMLQDKPFVSTQDPNIIAQREQLIEKIKQLEGDLIHPSVLKQQLLEERSKRQEQLSFMQKNYRNLEEEVEEMRSLLKQLRRKYKVASKEIFELEKQHQQEKASMTEQFRQLQRQNSVSRAVLNTLFTEKQYQNLVSLGQWESDEVFKLPPFYFKDKSTLAFPYENGGIGRSDSSAQKKDSKKLVFNSTMKKKP